MSQAPQQPPSSDAPTERMPDGPPPNGSGGSRNLWTVLGVGAGVIVLAVVLFFLLRPDDDSENTANTTPTAQTTTEETTTEETTEETTTEETTTEETTTTEPADQAQRIVVQVENGEPVGGAQSYDIEQGKQVVFIVRADVEDEVHIHGYDLAAEVAPGQQAKITFTANDPGEFEVELEQRVVPIAELIVSP